MNNILKQHAQTLRLSGLLESPPLRLQEAEANRLPYAQFLELLFQDEINVRHQRLINKRHKLADFRKIRSLDIDLSKNGANCSAMSLPPARSSTGCFIMPKSSPS